MAECYWYEIVKYILAFAVESLWSLGKTDLAKHHLRCGTCMGYMWIIHIIHIYIKHRHTIIVKVCVEIGTPNRAYQANARHGDFPFQYKPFQGIVFGGESWEHQKNCQRSKTLWIVSAKPWKKLAVELAREDTMSDEPRNSLVSCETSMSGEQKSKPMLFKTLAGYFFWDFFLASGTLGVQRPVKANEKKMADMAVPAAAMFGERFI